MQVSANIIVRQRPVITLLTDVFTKGSESFKIVVERFLEGESQFDGVA